MAPKCRVNGDIKPESLMEMAASLLRNQTQVRGQKQNTQESSPQFQLTHAFPARELSLPRNM